MERVRRRELDDEYRRRPREAAVYVVRDARTGRGLLASTPDLASVRDRLDFARETGMLGAVDRRLTAAIPGLRPETLGLEVLDVLDITPSMTDAEVREDLAALEAAWREQLGGPLIG